MSTVLHICCFVCSSLDELGDLFASACCVCTTVLETRVTGAASFHLAQIVDVP
jgi:hypothetical protein